MFKRQGQFTLIFLGSILGPNIFCYISTVLTLFLSLRTMSVFSKCHFRRMSSPEDVLDSPVHVLANFYSGRFCSRLLAISIRGIGGYFWPNPRYLTISSLRKRKGVALVLSLYFMKASLQLKSYSFCLDGKIKVIRKLLLTYNSLLIYLKRKAQR